MNFLRSEKLGAGIQEKRKVQLNTLHLETLIRDIRVSLRLLRRAPLSSAISILSITVSVGATAVVFAAVKSVLLNPLPYSHTKQLVQLRTQHDLAEPSRTDWVFWSDAQEIIRRTRTLQSVAIYRNAVFDLAGAAATPPEALYGLRATANLFPVLGVSPMLGRNISPGEDQPGHTEEMILSYGLWSRRFGRDRGIIGRNVKVNGHDCLVIGVMPPDFNFPLRRAANHTPSNYVEFWAPLRTGGPAATTGGLGAIARLRSGVSLVQAQQDLASISTALAHEFPNSNRDRTLRLAFLWDRVIGNARVPFSLLMTAALMFMLIGCANVANLLLARGLAREREISIRMAIGAGSGRIIRQLLTESCVLAAFGGVGAYALSLMTWYFLRTIAPVTIPRLVNTRADWTVFVFAFALALVNGVFFAIAPAIRSLRSAVPAAVHELGTRVAVSTRQNYTRSFLVTAEVTISVVLVLFAGQLLGEFLRLIQSDPGFQAQHVLAAVVLPEPERYATSVRRAAIYQRFLNSLYAVPGVENAGVIDALPFSGENHGGFISVDNSGAMEPNSRSVAEIDVIGGDYLQAMGARLLAGRWFRQEEAQKSTGTAIVNDLLAKRLWPAHAAVGQRICIDCTPENPNNWKQVIGVVSTLRHAALDGPPHLNVYLSAGAFEQAAFLVVRTDRPGREMDNAIRRAIAGIDPDQPVLLSTSLQSLIDDSVADRRFVANLLTSTASLALLMALAGIYGVTSYTTSRRTQEIGIRMALGATFRNVHLLVFRQGFVSIAAGLVIGLCLTSILLRALRGAVAGLEAGKLTHVGFAAALVILSAIAACWIPARRATTIGPMSALRQG